MFCPIHNPSGGVYDPNKEQFMSRRHALVNEYGDATVTTISMEKVPITPKPFMPPESIAKDAASVVQLDNAKLITKDYAAVTMRCGREPIRTYIFNVKLLPSNSPARQIVTALIYATEGRLYNRYESWTKQRRDSTNWENVLGYASVDVVRCYNKGLHHTPPSPGPIEGESMWESGETQAVTNEFAYLTGFNNRPQLSTVDDPFEHQVAEIKRISDIEGYDAEQRAAMLAEMVKNNQEVYTFDSRQTGEVPMDFTITVYPLDLIGSPLYWVGGNTADNTLVNVSNTDDLHEWFMDPSTMHIPNKQMFSDLGFKFPTADIDGSIDIHSNCAFGKELIGLERRYVESKQNGGPRYSKW